MTVRSRVRAILIARDARLLTNTRLQPDRSPYWVLPVGGTESDDANPEAALTWEIREEPGPAAHVGGRGRSVVAPWLRQPMTGGGTGRHRKRHVHGQCNTFRHSHNPADTAPSHF
ncbi:hypothetical protein FHU30_007452 [Actinomadura rupiterrae]|nr:hypothetical protein [Actinomadura rupiterrae]